MTWRGVLGEALGEAEAALPSVGVAVLATVEGSEGEPEACKDNRGDALATVELGPSSGDLGDILLAGSKGVTLIGDTLRMTGERILQSGDRPRAASWLGGNVGVPLATAWPLVAPRRRGAGVGGAGVAVDEAAAASSGTAGLGDSVSTAMLLVDGAQGRARRRPPSATR